MKTKKLLKIWLSALMAINLLAPLTFLGSLPVNAQRTINSVNGQCPEGYQKLSVAVGDRGEDCISVDTISKNKDKPCPNGFEETSATECKRIDSSPENNPIFIYLRNIVRFLAAGVGMVIVLVIIIAGVRYAASGGNPQAVESAKKMLFAAVAGLIAFIFLAAIINFLIPGGVIG